MSADQSKTEPLPTERMKSKVDLSLRFRNEALEIKEILQRPLEVPQLRPNPIVVEDARAALEEQLRYWNAHVRTRDEEEMRKRTEAALAAPPDPPSDAAKMRDVMEYVLQFDATDEAAEEDWLTDAERIAEYADHIEECQKKARAALAAPARNCDRFKTEGDAHREYLRIFDHPDPVHYAKWLFAPEEGGAE